MNKKEILYLSVAVFLTMTAFVVNTIYHIQHDQYVNQEIKDVSIPTINIDESVFSILKNKTE